MIKVTSWGRDGCSLNSEMIRDVFVKRR